MDELSIFVNGDLNWTNFISAVEACLGADGVDRSDEEVTRRQWIVQGYEVLAIRSPAYDDDCGIPFSQYSHQILILDATMNNRQNLKQQYEEFVRRLAMQMERSIPNEIVVVKNLQSIVA